MAARARWSWSRRNDGRLNRPATSTTSRAGARAISRSARTGTSCVHPEKDPARSIDLKELVDTLVLRGINLPILIRFADILKHRLGEIHSAFQTAINEHKYQGGYCCVYPIKVNQQRQVVEEVLEFGKPYHFGLEAGSKPELLAVMALADNETPDHLQRLQGRRVHRDGDAGPEDRPADHPGGREVHRAGADPEVQPSAWACGRRSACASSWPAAARAAGSRRAATAPSSA